MLTGTGLDQATGSRALAAFNLVGVAGALIAAWVIARVGSRATMIAIAAITVAAAILQSRLPVGPGNGVVGIIAMIGIIGGGINAVQTTLYALAAHVYPTPVRATGIGAAASVGRIGAILAAIVGNWALEHGGAASFFLLFAVAMTATLLAIAFIQRQVAPRHRTT